MKQSRFVGLVIIGLFVLAAFAFYIFDGARFFTLAQLQQYSSTLASYTRDHYFLGVTVYFAIFITVIAFSLPVTGPLTLLGGFLFGVVRGSLLATLGATAGATIAFLLLRRGVKDVAGTKRGARLQRFKKNLKKQGAWYLLMMHFSTVLPYAVINVIASLAGVSVATVAWTTFVGFIPIGLVYSFAGSQLTTITSMGDVFSPPAYIFPALPILNTLIMVAAVTRFVRVWNYAHLTD